MTDRCEPPPELRGVVGWHWLGADCPVFWIAEEQEWDWTEDEHVAPDAAYRYGYRYLSPVATPAEVEALRAERDGAIAKIERMTEHAQNRDKRIRAQRAALRENWMIVDQRKNWIGSPAARRLAGVHIKLIRSQTSELTTLRARVAELEEALREISNNEWSGAQVPRNIARAALSPTHKDSSQ